MSLSPPAPTSSSLLAVAPSGPSAIRRLRIALGTWVAIEAKASSAAAALAGTEAAFAAIAQVDWRMHPTRQGSDVARINLEAPGVRVPIHPSTWWVLRLAQRVSAFTQGVFDPCVPDRPGRLRDLQLSAHAATDCTPWALCQTPLALDLGGIAKGYAIDCAVDALIAAGCTAGLVNAGGDLRLFGTRCESILLRHADGTCWPLTLDNTALAVSDIGARRRPSEHRGYYRRAGMGRPARRYAAVLAREAAVADALTKCVLLAPAHCARRALQELGGREVA
jgi:FAD:protein FMN transferase